MSDLFSGLDRGARHQAHLAHLHGIGERNHVACGRPSARARSATVRVSSVEPSSTTMISNGRKVCCCSDAIVGPSPEPPLKVGMITLTAASLAGTLSLRLHAPNRANESSDSE